MIVLVNGAFGVGKTTTARLLVERIPRAALHDPERIGSLLRATVGRVITRGDYQDLPGWQPLVVGTTRVLHQVGKRNLIVPMCIWRRDYFDGITAEFRAITPDVICLRLTASEATLRRRILDRPEDQGGHAWGLSHMNACITAFGNAHFGIEIPTNGKSPDAVAIDALARICPRA